MTNPMPVARPPLDPVPPAPVTEEEAAFIKQTIQSFYGSAAIVRNYGPLPSQLALHIEADRHEGIDKWACIGVLWTRIDRQITIEISGPNARRRGNVKLAYRQGVIL
jgi:hypothetical protein